MAEGTTEERNNTVAEEHSNYAGSSFYVSDHSSCPKEYGTKSVAVMGPLEKSHTLRPKNNLTPEPPDVSRLIDEA